MKLSTLSFVTAALTVISLVVFVQENKRGTDLATGSDYIKGLDIEKTQKIVLSFKDDKKIVLTRDSNKFVLENHKSYPADISKVNDLIYKVASIQVKEKVSESSGEEDLKKYELDQKSLKYNVDLYDTQGKKTVSFRVGKNHKGKGNYLVKEGAKDIYLSKSSLWLNSSYKDFVDTVLVKIKKDDVAKVNLNSDKEIVIARKDKDFVVEKPAKNLKKEKVEEFIGGLAHLRFEEFYAPTDEDVRGLTFNKNLKVQLKNKLIYNIDLAQDKDKYFVKMGATLDEVPNNFVVRQDDSKEKLLDIENMVKAQGQAQKVNLEKGFWVYKVNKPTFEKLAKDLKFFM